MSEELEPLAPSRPLPSDGYQEVLACIRLLTQHVIRMQEEFAAARDGDGHIDCIRGISEAGGKGAK